MVGTILSTVENRVAHAEASAATCDLGGRKCVGARERRRVGEIIAAINAGGFDAIYLDLRGAMVTEQHDDAEGEFPNACAGVSAIAYRWSSHGIFMRTSPRTCSSMPAPSWHTGPILTSTWRVPANVLR